MKNIKTVLAILTISLVFSVFTTAASAKPSKASWTFMVYLDADNNLDPYGPLNIQQMSSGLTPEANLNVIVLMDRLNQPAYLYRITYNKVETILSLGEVDMCSPETLTWFVKYTLKTMQRKITSLTSGTMVEATVESAGTTQAETTFHHTM